MGSNDAYFECTKHETFNCSIYKPSIYPKSVMITAGGKLFHRSGKCYWLNDGQDAVDARGGDRSERETLSPQVAEARWKAECYHCFRWSCVVCGSKPLG